MLVIKRASPLDSSRVFAIYYTCTSNLHTHACIYMYVCLFCAQAWWYNFILIAHNFDSPRDKIKRIIIERYSNTQRRLEWSRIQLKQWCAAPAEREKADIYIFEESSNLPRPSLNMHASSRNGIHRIHDTIVRRLYRYYRVNENGAF